MQAELKQALQDLKAAESIFNNVTEEVQIDMAIHRWNDAEETVIKVAGQAKGELN